MSGSDSPPPGSEPVVPASGLWLPNNPDTDKLLTPASRVIPFLGAGVSKGAGHPDGVGIIDRLCQVYGVSQTELDGASIYATDPREVASYIIRQKAVPIRDVQESVAQLYAERRGNLKPTRALAAIASVQSKWVLTFNYDDSVEETARQLGFAPSTYTWMQPPPLEHLRSDSTHPLNVFHVHGYYEQPETIVLDMSSYGFILGTLLRVYLDNFLVQNTICFLGTTLDEAYLASLLGMLQFNAPSHVLFTQASEAAQIAQGPRGRVNETHSVIIEAFPDGAYGELDSFCEHYFVSRTVAASSLAVSDFTLPPPVETFIAPILVPVPAGSTEIEIPTAWRVELGSTTPVTAEELAHKSRTVVVGRPGSGKTQLLRQAAASVPTGERAVYVRLVGVPDPVGDPIAMLTEWARSTQPDDLQHELSGEDFGRARFHFLLDGFDEVPSSRQAQLADRIIAMARALPQHRFTVTSRLVPSVALFDSADWERMELVTTTKWRKEFLAQFGLTYDELLGEAPALRPLSELLSLPFFLNAVMELRADGPLPTGADAMGLAQALLDRSLDDPGLRPLRDAVRPWLRDVALVMQMAGRNELTPAELGLANLPEGLDLGQTEAVLEKLTFRSLLEYDGDRIRFVHRLLGDALTAEKLIELGPSVPGLLDVIVPLTDSVRGLRNDWLTVMTLVGSRDGSWRDAIAERDSLAAARMVLPNSEQDVRRDAARSLWNAYVNSRLWMHSFTGPGLLHDAEIVGSLLREGDLPEVVDEVLGGIHNPSPQVRSNAMEVLAGAGLDSDLSPLVRAALAGDPLPVVRRQAAGAAVARKLTVAFPLIRSRAVTSGDELEIQDMVALGLKLAPDEEVLPFALEIVERGHGRHWAVEQTVRERLGPAAALKVLRRQAEHLELPILGARTLRELAAEFPAGEEATEDIAFIAVFGGDVDAFAERLREHPDAAMRGLIAAMESALSNFIVGARLVLALPDEALDNATFTDERMRERLLEIRSALQAPAPAAPGSKASEEEEESPDDEAQPTLPELLARSDEQADDLLVRNAMYFAPAVSGLSSDDRVELERRIRAWWPASGLSSEITETGQGQFTISWRTQACLAYGSRLKPKLSEAKWFDMVQAPVWYEGKDDWLRERYQRRAVLRAARTWKNDDTKTWARLAEVIPETLPRSVVTGIARNVERLDELGRQLLGRLLEEGQHGALRALAKVRGELGIVATEYLARAGDVKAQSISLNMLIADFGTDKTIHSHDVSWLESVADSRLLPKLFEALVGAMNHVNPGRDSFNDTPEPIHNAIRRIGGVEAIESYNQLMAQEPPPFEGVQFEALQRDTIIHDMLRAVGDEGRPAAMAALGLPLIDAAPA